MVELTKVRVLVVDDSIVVRRLIAGVIDSDPLLTCCGMASNGAMALEQIERLKPDLVTLDIEMPIMDGLATVRAIRKNDQTLPIVMFSTLTERGARATLDALDAGASDYVTKPSHVTGLKDGNNIVELELLPRLKALARRSIASRTSRPAPVAPTIAVPTLAPVRQSTKIDVVAIGVSTGGPNALAHMVPLLPADLGVPVVMVQHMPAMFTKMLADRLNDHSPLRVIESLGGDILTPGTIFVAPGDWHMTIERDGANVVTRVNQDAPVHSCRPSVDVLFDSAKGVYGGNVLSVILTGMGSDGANGCAAIREAGGQVIVQDEESSVVWGMPGAVVARNLQDAILPLDEIAGEITKRVRRSSNVRPIDTAPSGSTAGSDNLRRGVR